MKIKTSWKVVAGLAAAAAVWLKLGEGVTEPPKYITVGETDDPCPPGQYRVWGFQEQGYVCIKVK